MGEWGWAGGGERGWFLTIGAAYWARAAGIAAYCSAVVSQEVDIQMLYIYIKAGVLLDSEVSMGVC